MSPGFAHWRDSARWAFIAIAAALLPIMVLASFDFGVTWDEKDRHRNGQLIWEFLRGLRSRSSFPETGGHLYPGFFDVICAALEEWVPVNRYVLRHTVNATFGWIGVIYCGRLAARLFGQWTGVLAMVLLGTSPRYFADSMNNPKDLPFAAMTVMALYYISTVSPRWPYVTPSAAIKIAVSLALALGVRVGALLYVGYFGALISALVVADRCTDWRRLSDTVVRVAGVAVAVLVLGTVFWPWAQGSPLTRPFQALVGATGFPWTGAVLFNGREYSGEDVPWYYVPWWVLISTPPVVLVGAALSACVPTNREGALCRAALGAVVVCPVAATIVMGSTLYDGIRHLEFIYPALVVLAASGWTMIICARRRPIRVVAASCLTVGVLSILVFDIRFHPNQGVYFNTLVGGSRGAFARYDMDYWGNCVLQAVEWSVDAARAAETVVTVSGNPWHLVQLNAERFPQVYFTPPQRNRHYLNLRLARGPAAALRDLAAQPALHQVRTPDGVVLCTVMPGPAFHELEALRARAASRNPSPQAKPR